MPGWSKKNFADVTDRSPNDTMRAFEAGPEGLDVLCIGGRRPEGGDAERDETFWT